VTGLSLNVAVGAQGSTQTVPSLAPGETYIAKVPVNDITLRTAGSLTFTTQLTNPLGVTDQVPANNRKSTVLTAPTRTRQSAMAGLSHQVTVYAAEGATSSEIARRTGLAHDAIALILHFRQPTAAASTTGHGTLRRNDSGSGGWVADA
jgi:hypothetical protein